jgi:hypothetical protein
MLRNVESLPQPPRSSKIDLLLAGTEQGSPTVLVVALLPALPSMEEQESSIKIRMKSFLGLCLYVMSSARKTTSAGPSSL